MEFSPFKCIYQQLISKIKNDARSDAAKQVLHTSTFAVGTTLSQHRIRIITGMTPNKALNYQEKYQIFRLKILRRFLSSRKIVACDHMMEMEGDVIYNPNKQDRHPIIYKIPCLLSLCINENSLCDCIEQVFPLV